MFFAKIYGSVRYFYPSKAAKQTDWDKFAIYGVREVKACRNDKELIIKINALFLPLCGELKINTIRENDITIHQKEKYKTMEHYGNGNSFVKIPLFYKPYFSKIKRSKKGDTICLYSDKVDENLSFSMPTASRETKVSKPFRMLKHSFDTISTNKANVTIQLFHILLLKKR
jgi:hypothetical protein